MIDKTDSRIERKKEETQSKIIRVAVELFNQHGLEAVTMERIAEEVDIAKGTLYNYFPSKEAIIDAYLQRTFRERSGERLAQIRQFADTRSRLVRLFALLIEGVQAHKEMFEVFMVYRMKQVISFKPAEGAQIGLSLLIHDIIVRGKDAHELRADMPDDILEDLVEFALFEAIMPLYLQPDDYDPARSIDRCVDLFLTGAQFADNNHQKP
jgi:AcrR family transcriptional regulator